jgi:hypothetical protein
MRAELVTMKGGATIRLGQMLEILKLHDLDWTPYEPTPVYEAFRAFNSHMALPPATAAGKIPGNANVRLKNPSRRVKLRFFLPIGATSILAEAGHDVFDSDEMRLFNDDTYADPVKTQQKSLLDWEYDRVVGQIGRFGFTEEIRSRVNEIAEQMEKLAEDKPTPYRRSQAVIAGMHKRLWSFGPWVKLEKAVAQTRNIHHEQLRQGSAPPDTEESSDDSP